MISGVDLVTNLVNKTEYKIREDFRKYAKTSH